MLLHGLVEFGTYDYCLKLKQDGVIRNLVQLITSFLKCRFQRVILNGHTSDCETIHAGVLQGSILGPSFVIQHILMTSQVI